MHILARYINQHLTLELLDMPINEFLGTSMWKVRLAALRGHHPKVAENSLVFPGDLSAADCRGIMTRLEKLAERGVEIFTDQSYNTQIGQKISLLNERAVTGLAIKGQDPSVRARFEEFSKIVNENMVRKLRDKQMWDAFL